jgi:hypothetical protein
VIHGAEAVNKSYPDFFDHYRLLGGKVTLFSGVGFPFLEFLRFGEYSVPGAIGMVVAFGVSLALGLVFGFEKAQQKN